MTTYLTPFIDVTVNAQWDDWEKYPQGRPNPLYSHEASAWHTDGLVFGFITLSPNNNPCWGGNDAMPLNWAIPLAQDINAAGLKTIVSFGGASNSDISTHFSAAELENIYISAINMYQAKGLDFDLENGLYDMNKIFAALANVQKSKPQVVISLTLPVMPTGLTEVGMKIILTAKAAGVSFIVNGMAMDYFNPVDDADMGFSAIKAAKSVKSQLATLYPTYDDKQLYAHVAITPMIGLNDDGAMFNLDDALQLASFAKTNGLNFLGFWDLNRDNPSSFTYVDLMTSSNPEQVTSGQYCTTLAGGLTG